MRDLHAGDDWNCVFGQATLRECVGVDNFARYDPGFYGEARGDDAQTLILRRNCKVLAHETGHMFGMVHCIYFRCLMNGASHLGEDDATPLHLCPVCLRKLHHAVGLRHRRAVRASAGVQSPGRLGRRNCLDHPAVGLREILALAPNDFFGVSCKE